MARVNISPYENCANYCEAFGLACVGAYEDSANGCEIESEHLCNETIIGSHGVTPDIICECGQNASKLQT